MRYLKLYEESWWINTEETFFEISEDEYYKEEMILPMPIGDREFIKLGLRKLGLIINLVSTNIWKVQYFGRRYNRFKSIGAFYLVDDEWYIVERGGKFYKCDGACGLVDFFKKIDTK